MAYSLHQYRERKIKSMWLSVLTYNTFSLSRCCSIRTINFMFHIPYTHGVRECVRWYFQFLFFLLLSSLLLFLSPTKRIYSPYKYLPYIICVSVLCCAVCTYKMYKNAKIKHRICERVLQTNHRLGDSMVWIVSFMFVAYVLNAFGDATKAVQPRHSISPNSKVENTTIFFGYAHDAIWN